MNGSRKKKQRKAQTKMGEIHQRYYVLYDGSSKQSGGGAASRAATQALLTMLREEIHIKKYVTSNDDNSGLQNKCWFCVCFASFA